MPRPSTLQKPQPTSQEPSLSHALDGEAEERVPAQKTWALLIPGSPSRVSLASANLSFHSPP